MILTLMGPSGVGKTTLLHNLLGVVPNSSPLTSVTTRAPRPTDEPGEYDYITHEEFAHLAERGEFLWEAQTTGNWYGTRRISIDAALQSDQCYIPILVLSAAKTLYEYAKANNVEGAVQFLYLGIADEAELRRRFSERGDSLAETNLRIAECKTWDSDIKKLGIPYTYIDSTKTREALLTAALQSLDTNTA